MTHSPKVARIAQAAAELRQAETAERDALLSTIAPDQQIWVRRQWDGRLSAAYRFDQIERLHLTDTGGGVGTRANRLYVHGYVQCDQMTDGDLDHSCAHGPPPHRIKVCIVGVDNGGNRSKLMKTVKRLAELNPRR